MTEENEKGSSINAASSQDVVFEVSRLIKQRLSEIKDLLHDNKPNRTNPEYLRKVLSSIGDINEAVSEAIDARSDLLKSIKTDEEEHRVEENLRPLSQNLNDALMETSLGIWEITKWFTYEKESDSDWKQTIETVERNLFSGTENLAGSLSHKPFEASYWAQMKLQEMNSNDTTKRDQLPSQHLFIEVQLLNSISHLHGVLHSILFYILKVTNIFDYVFFN